MRYVTCYESFLSGLADVVFHDNKDDAVKFYRREANCYFNNLRLPKKIDAPAVCGFPHRKFMVLSIRRFKQLFPGYSLKGSNQ